MSVQPDDEYLLRYGTQSRRGSRVAAAARVGSLLLAVALGFLLYRVWFDRGTAALEPRTVTARGDLAADEKSTIELFKEASPSVAYITTLRQGRDFWLRPLEVPAGTGSGFVWDDAGDIVTNFHVVQNASGATVTLWDHSVWPAQLVGVAPSYDLALLRIKAPKSKLRPIPVGTSKDLQVGQKTFAIGNPFGLDQTITTGIVSALGRTINSVTGFPIEDVIQTDASINPGNSGGPLLDSAGRLMGVNTAIFSPTGTSAGIGFAVPVDTVNRIIPQLLTRGKVIRPETGLKLNDPISQQITRQLGVPGVLIIAIDQGSTAEVAGLRPTRRLADGSIAPGDVIQKADGRDVRTADQFFAILERHKPGDVIPLHIWREGQEQDVQLKLEEPKQ